MRDWSAMTHPDDLAALRRARDRMDREYASGLRVSDLAAAAHMSTGHFQRSFKAGYGETPHSYLMTRRVERAMMLLRGRAMSVTEVCMAVGASSLGSFSSRFTELVGETPSAYRAREHGPLESLPACVARIVGRPVRIEEAPLRPRA